VKTLQSLCLSRKHAGTAADCRNRCSTKLDELSTRRNVLVGHYLPPLWHANKKDLGAIKIYSLRLLKFL
jgi:hypothetical protein